MDYKNCLGNDSTVLKSQQKFRSEAHNMLMEMEKVNKNTFSKNDYKRIQTPDVMTTYPPSYALEKYEKQNWWDTQKSKKEYND